MTNSKKAKKPNIRPNQKFERKESYLPHEVLDFLPNPDDYPKGFKLKTIKKEYDGDMMKMGSQRYYTFAKSLKCEFCSIEGSIMHKERGMGKNGQPQKCGFHFNLYALNENNEEIMMTKDHVVARSRGGKDKLKNYVTCCKICNEEKGSMDFEEFKKLKQKELQEAAKKAMFERQAIGRCLRVPSNVKILEIENKDI